MATTKKEFYHNEFNKYENDIRKTWDTLTEIINKKPLQIRFSILFRSRRRWNNRY